MHAYETIGTTNQALAGQMPDQMYPDHLTTRRTASSSAIRQAPLLE
jgi:hypothetical protein